MKKISITISLAEDLVNNIGATAKEIGISRSQLIEDLIILGVKAVEINKYSEIIKEYRQQYENGSDKAR